MGWNDLDRMVKWREGGDETNGCDLRLRGGCDGLRGSRQHEASRRISYEYLENILLPNGFRVFRITSPMTRSMHLFHDAAENKWVVFLGTIASILSFVLALRTEFKSIPIDFGLAFVITAFFATAFYSVRVREQILAWQKVCPLIHNINHTYRDVLSAAFGEQVVNTDADSGQKSERATVMVACQKIASIFSAITLRECTVTVKLINKNPNNVWVCQTYARSDLNSVRDQNRLMNFSINTGENTAFDSALALAPCGISHFFSADLSKMKKDGLYRNQRDDFERYYRSALVVPIRCRDNQKAGQPGASNDIGFLCVDTLSTNRLNDRYHLALLAALADQLYNYLSLTRGHYLLPSRKKENIKK
jgi:hypothetical protein